jgi:sulfur carrier protein
MTMNILINDKPFTLPDGATLTDALAALEAVPPSAYAARALQPDDRIEVIRPVTGG